MEITAATIAQRGQIRALWAESFPDETFQKWFFANLYREEYTVVALCGGRVRGGSCARLYEPFMELTADSGA